VRSSYSQQHIDEQHVYLHIRSKTTRSLPARGGLSRHQSTIAGETRHPTSALTLNCLALHMNVKRSQRCYCRVMHHFPANAATITRKKRAQSRCSQRSLHPCDTSMAAAKMSRGSTARGWDESRYLPSRSCETSETLLCHEFPRTGRVLGI
jgi:hypothetical protein